MATQFKLIQAKCLTALLASSIFATTAAADNNDLVKGLMGAMIGAAIINEANKANAATPKKSNSKPAISSAQRQENKEIQEGLNTFGFNAGTPDGIMGKNSKLAASKFQACLDRPVTGVLDTFEKDFLAQSALKFNLNKSQSLRFVAQNKAGYCGLLQTYMGELLGTESATAEKAAPKVAVQNVQITSPNVVQQNIQNTNVVVIETTVQQNFDRLSDEILLLEKISEHISTKTNSDSHANKLKAITQRISILRTQIRKIEGTVQNKYGVPIRPTNSNLGLTSRRASQIFPRVPYFIPGTSQNGEIWIKPIITDQGSLVYEFNFTDNKAEFDQIIEKVLMNEENLSMLAESMVKINKWSDTAIEKGVRKRYSKTAACFPQSMCGQIETGNTSTEFVFVIYEDGSTSAAIKRNKGTFSSNYNLSVESGLLLSAYADFMKDLGSNEYKLGTMTNDDLDEMFAD